MLENTNPLAMVCVGGAGDVAEQVLAFRQTRIGSTRPIYVLERTGGDAPRLGVRTNVESIDRLFIDEILRLRPQFRMPEEREAFIERPTLVPYPLVMQLFVEKQVG